MTLYKSASGAEFEVDSVEQRSGNSVKSRVPAVVLIGEDGTPAGIAASIYSDQQVVTASAAALTAQALVNGLTLRAKATNTGSVFVGPAGVNATDTGSGNGFALLPGAAISLAVSNASAVYIIGTASDIVYVIGN
jgi:hypothetical protein